MSGKINEILSAGNNRFQQQNERIRSATTDAAFAFDAVQPGDRIQEFKKKNNYISLATGDHGGLVIDKNNTQIKTLGQARITNKATVNESAVFNGVIFQSDRDIPNRNNADCLVEVTTGESVFIGCTFIKDAGDPMNSSDTNFQNFVMIQEGAKAIFSGCVFLSSDTSMKQTGDVVRNHSANPAGNVYVVYSVNKTGQLNSNTTDTGVLT